MPIPAKDVRQRIHRPGVVGIVRTDQPVKPDFDRIDRPDRLGQIIHRIAVTDRIIQRMRLMRHRHTKAPETQLITFGNRIQKFIKFRLAAPHE